MRGGGGGGGVTPPKNFTTRSMLKFDSGKVGPDLALCLVFLSITPILIPVLLVPCCIAVQLSI